MAQWPYRGEILGYGCFKRIPEGWVFQAPSPWIFFGRRHYLVSDAQRERIVAFFDDLSERALLFISVIAATIVGLWLASMLLPTNLLTVLLVLAVVRGLTNSYFLSELRPMLAGAPRTTERITFSDHLRANAATIPLWSLILCLAVFGLFGTLSAREIFTSPWNIHQPINSLVSIVVCGWAVFHCVAILIVKMTPGPRHESN
jgi:hypothetical protein